MSISDGHRIFVLDPTATPRELRREMAPRLPDLRGRSIGFLWNTKPNGEVLFSQLEELLRHKYEITLALQRGKAMAPIPAPREVLDELAASTEAVIVGIGD